VDQLGELFGVDADRRRRMAVHDAGILPARRSACAGRADALRGSRVSLEMVCCFDMFLILCDRPEGLNSLS